MPVNFNADKRFTVLDRVAYNAPGKARNRVALQVYRNASYTPFDPSQTEVYTRVRRVWRHLEYVYVRISVPTTIEFNVVGGGGRK